MSKITLTAAMIQSLAAFAAKDGQAFTPWHTVIFRRRPVLPDIQG